MCIVNEPARFGTSNVIPRYVVVHITSKTALKEWNTQDKKKKTNRQRQLQNICSTPLVVNDYNDSKVKKDHAEEQLQKLEDMASVDE